MTPCWCLIPKISHHHTNWKTNFVLVLFFLHFWNPFTGTSSPESLSSRKDLTQPEGNIMMPNSEPSGTQRLRSSSTCGLDTGWEGPGVWPVSSLAPSWVCPVSSLAFKVLKFLRHGNDLWQLFSSHWGSALWLVIKVRPGSSLAPCWHDAVHHNSRLLFRSSSSRIFYFRTPASLCNMLKYF